MVTLLMGCLCQYREIFYKETCWEIQILAIKAAIFTRRSTRLAVPLQFEENGLVYTFLTTNGSNKRFLNPAKRENDARKSGVRKDSCVYEVKKRSKTCSTRGCILHILSFLRGKIKIRSCSESMFPYIS